MSTTSKGMVQVSGTTYRIVRAGSAHQVFRVADDRFVGSFTFGPALSLLECRIDAESLRAVARQALRSSRLDWRPARKRARHADWTHAVFAKLHAARGVLFWLRSGRPELSRRLA
jgi:hypothetical protein